MNPFQDMMYQFSEIIHMDKGTLGALAYSLWIYAVMDGATRFRGHHH